MVLDAGKRAQASVSLLPTNTHVHESELKNLGLRRT